MMIYNEILRSETVKEGRLLEGGNLIDGFYMQYINTNKTWGGIDEVAL